MVSTQLKIHCMLGAKYVFNDLYTSAVNPSSGPAAFPTLALSMALYTSSSEIVSLSSFTGSLSGCKM